MLWLHDQPKSYKFEDPHTISYAPLTMPGCQWETHKKKGPQKITAKYKCVMSLHISIATGGRPWIPDDVPGAREHAMTSDDRHRVMASGII